MTQLSASSRNIRLAYILTFLSELYFPFIVFLFFYLRYLNFTQVATLLSLQLLTTNLLEIPTGAFADLVGRRTSILLSFATGAIMLFIFPFATTFVAFALLEIIKGASYALYSGSLEALTYDSLKQDGKENDYDHVAANLETISWIAYLGAAALAGFLYEWNFRSPWLIQGVLYTLGTLIALLLIEPRLDSVKYHFRTALTQNMQGFRELFRNRSLTHLTLTLITIGAGYFIAANILGISQAREYGLDPKGVGLLFGIGYVASILASRFFTRLRKKLGEKKLISLTTSALLTSFLLARFTGVTAGSTLITLRIASSSTFRNTRSVLVNRELSSRNRATALSTLNLLTSTPYIFLAPALGYLIDLTSPNQFAMYLGGALALLLSIIKLSSLRTHST